MRNLTKIVLSGFKSFASQTEIPFLDGITGIVGPNGCGKSNISDAVRWVLGETNSSVRADSMVDLIFKGSPGKKNARNSAEVSLYFDNYNGMLKADSGEIQVSRRIFSDNTSQYFINGVQCRRKEIQALMRDTGVGQGGYAIISQGKVDAIIRSKPEQRLEIFEEAAGIRENKKEKNDTKEKLKAIEIEIATLEKIAFEKEKALEPITAQREVLLLRRKKEEEYKTLLANCYLTSYRNSEAKKKVQQEAIAGFTDLLTAKLNALASAESERAVLNSDATSHELRVREIYELIADLRVNAESADKKVAIFKTESQKLTSERSNILSALMDYQQQKQENETKTDEATKVLEQRRELLSSVLKKNSELGFRMAKLNSMIDNANREGSASSDELMSTLNASSDIKADKSRYEEKAENLRRDIASSEETVIKLHSEQEKNKQLIETLKNNRIAKEKERQQLTPRFQELNSKIITKNGELQTAETTVNELYSRKTTLETQFRRIDASVSALNEARKTSTRVKNAIVGLFSELITYDSRYESAMAAALGKVMQNFVVETENEAMDMVKYLDEYINLGRCTFLPLNKVKGYPLEDRFRYVLGTRGCVGVASELCRFDDRYYYLINRFLGKVIVVEDMKVGFEIQSKHPGAYKLVTLNGEIIEASGALTGGKRGDDSADKAKLEKIRQLYQRQQDAVKSIKNEIEALRTGIDKLREEASKAGSEIEVIQVKIENAEKAIATAAEQIATLEFQIESKKKEVENIEQTLFELTSRSANASDAQKQLNEKLQAAQGNAELLTKMKDKLSEAKTAISARKAQLETAINLTITDIAGFERARDEAIEAIEEKTKQLAEKEAEINELTKNAPSIQLSHEETEKCKQLEEEQTALKEGINKKRARIQELEVMEKELQTAVAELREKKIKAEGKLDGIDFEVDKYASLLADNYGMDIEACKLFELEHFSVNEGEKRMKALRNEMEKLGSINYNAEEEYERLKKEYDTLKLELEDCIKAKDDISSLLDDITKAMNVAFYKSFNQINANFGEIFKQLFGKRGNAELVCEMDRDDGSPLGVEIIMRPPGKPQQPLKLYSGGEQSLTAIAILFAILKLAPTPFCLLDEIDAALDEPNALKYIEYMNNLKNETQFIVITHKKATMECADRLYGVTMPDGGISKIFTISLKDALKTAEEDKGE